MHIRKLGEPFGAEVFDLRIEDISESDVRGAFRQALFENLLLIVREASFGLDGQIQLTKVFGPILAPWDEAARHKTAPNLQLVRAVQRPKGSPLSASQHWHTDGSFLRAPPIATLLAAVHVPEIGGDTLFSDTRTAFDALPVKLVAKIRGTRLRFSYHHRLDAMHAARYGPGVNVGKPEYEDVHHPLVRRHPATGRASLYLDELCVVGIANEHDGAADLLDEVYSYALGAKSRYQHLWRAGDLLVWDNASLLHRRGGEHVGERLMHRTLAAGTPPAPFFREAE